MKSYTLLAVACLLLLTTVTVFLLADISRPITGAGTRAQDMPISIDTAKENIRIF